MKRKTKVPKKNASKIGFCPKCAAPAKADGYLNIAVAGRGSMSAGASTATALLNCVECHHVWYALYEATRYVEVPATKGAKQ